MNALVDGLNQWGALARDYGFSILWQSSLLIGLLVILDLALSRYTRSGFRYGLWLLLLVKMIVPPSLAIPTSPAYWLRAEEEPPSAIEPVVPMMIELPQATPGLRTSPVSISRPVESEFVPRGVRLNADGWLLVAWACGAFLLTGWLTWRWAWAVRLVRGAVPTGTEISLLLEHARERLGRHGPGRPPRVRCADALISPALCGLVRPVILLPKRLMEQLTRDQVCDVLCHELVHLRRGDLWINNLQTMLKIVFWWHPLLWIANARIRQVREQAVDETVAWALEDDGVSYSETLVTVAKFNTSRTAGTMGLIGILESRSALAGRIRRLLKLSFTGSPRLRVWQVGVILSLAITIIPMAQGEDETIPAGKEIAIDEAAIVKPLAETESPHGSDPVAERALELSSRKEKIRVISMLERRIFTLSDDGELIEGSDAVLDEIDSGTVVMKADNSFSETETKELCEAVGAKRVSYTVIPTNRVLGEIAAAETTVPSLVSDPVAGRAMVLSKFHSLVVRVTLLEHRIFTLDSDETLIEGRLAVFDQIRTGSIVRFNADDSFSESQIGEFMDAAMANGASAISFNELSENLDRKIRTPVGSVTLVEKNMVRGSGVEQTYRIDEKVFLRNLRERIGLDREVRDPEKGLNYVLGEFGRRKSVKVTHIHIGKAWFIQISLHSPFKEVFKSTSEIPNGYGVEHPLFESQSNRMLAADAYRYVTVTVAELNGIERIASEIGDHWFRLLTMEQHHIDRERRARSLPQDTSLESVIFHLLAVEGIARGLPFIQSYDVATGALVIYGTGEELDDMSRIALRLSGARSVGEVNLRDWGNLLPINAHLDAVEVVILDFADSLDYEKEGPLLVTWGKEKESFPVESYKRFGELGLQVIQKPTSNRGNDIPIENHIALNIDSVTQNESGLLSVYFTVIGKGIFTPNLFLWRQLERINGEWTIVRPEYR